MSVADYDPIFEDAGKEWNVDSNILRAMAARESSGNPVAVSPAGARGLMQIMPQTGQRLGLIDPNNPAQSIYAAAKEMRRLLDHYKDPATAIAAYNAGDKTINGVLAGQRALPNETAGYVPAVHAEYQKLVGTAQAMDKKKQAKSAPQASPEDTGRALFEKMTGQKAPPPAGEAELPAKETAIDVSSDPAADRGREIFKSMTGLDPDAPDKPAVAAVTSGVPTQAAQPAAASHTPLQNLGAGFAKGLNDVASPLVGMVASNPLVAKIDQMVPALGRLDKTYSPDPAANKLYDQQFGDSLLAQVGRFGGQTAAVLPATAAIGTGGSMAAGLTGSGLAARAGVNMLAGAAQGALGAASTGGDVTSGAIAGGALGGLGTGVGLVGRSMESNGLLGRAMNSKMADYIAKVVGSGAGYLHSDVVGALIGSSIGPLLKEITEKYGASVAKASAFLIQKSMPVTAPAAGNAAGQFTNKLTGADQSEYKR